MTVVPRLPPEDPKFLIAAINLQMDRAHYCKMTDQEYLAFRAELQSRMKPRLAEIVRELEKEFADRKVSGKVTLY